jgi:hypothetical protein
LLLLLPRALDFAAAAGGAKVLLIELLFVLITVCCEGTVTQLQPLAPHTRSSGSGSIPPLIIIATVISWLRPPAEQVQRALAPQRCLPLVLLLLLLLGW